jgi:hypothetical protein
MYDPLPEGCRFNDDLYGSRQRTVPGERIVDINGNIVLRFASVRDNIDLVLLCRPRRRTSGPEDPSGRSMSLSSNAERSRRIVVIPGIPSNENVRRVGGHGRSLRLASLEVLSPRDSNPSEIRALMMIGSESKRPYAQGAFFEVHEPEEILDQYYWWTRTLFHSPTPVYLRDTDGEPARITSNSSHAQYPKRGAPSPYFPQEMTMDLALMYLP